MNSVPFIKKLGAIYKKIGAKNLAPEKLYAPDIFRKLTPKKTFI